MLAHGLHPSPEEDRYGLIRRVFLDLTGLPPTVEEADAFVTSKDPQAYEKLVDDLLHRSSYGEHWARMWLDLARYADSAGYADDPPRTIWAYRDWVIKAFNDNKPFDEFTIEQIAGDLLPNPSEDQLIATAFHRNSMPNHLRRRLQTDRILKICRRSEGAIRDRIASLSLPRFASIGQISRAALQRPDTDLDKKRYGERRAAEMTTHRSLG